MVVSRSLRALPRIPPEPVQKPPLQVESLEDWFTKGVSRLFDNLKTTRLPDWLTPNRDGNYRYKRIEADEEIRLFQFAADPLSDQISISLKKYNVFARPRQLPPYLCVSYTWGDLTMTRPILCDGQTMYITENLYNALRRFRTRFAQWNMWADQICINQSNNEEKAEQILLISQIFPNAATVICWLGEENEYTKKAFEVLKDWDQAEMDEELRLRLARRMTGDSAKFSSETLEMQRAVQSFFDREWFRRAWTLQEVCVPNTRNPLVIWGDHSMTWHSLINAFWAISMTLPGLEPASLLGVNVRFALPMFTMYLDRSDGTRGNRMSTYVKQAFQREARDGRDRLFSLLGFVKQDEANGYPKPDYSLTERQVLIVYSRAMVEQDESLEILCIVRQALLNCNDMPSWVLTPTKTDFQLQNTDQSIATGNSTGATKGTKPICGQAQSRFDENLKLKGLPVSPVLKVFDLKLFQTAISKPDMRWRQILSEVYAFSTSLELPSIYEHTGEELVSVLMASLICGEFYTLAPSTAEEHSIPRGRLFYRHALRFEHEEPGLCDGMTAEKLFERTAGKFRFDRSALQDDATPVTECEMKELNNHAEWLDTTISNDLVDQIQYNTRRRTLAVTASNHLALVPEGTTVGDEICLLLGGRTPFALRKGSRGGEYMLLGNTYVHGIMNGEYWEKYMNLLGLQTEDNGFEGLIQYCLV